MTGERIMPLLKAALVLAVSGFLTGMVAVAVALSFGLEVDAALVVRGTLVLVAVLLAATRIRATPGALAAGAAAGYLLDPFSWSGVTVFAQLVFDAGVLSFVVDGVLWVAMALLGGVLRARWAGDQPRQLATPYG